MMAADSVRLGHWQRCIRLYHTLRPLKPVQFYGRLWQRVYRPRPELAPAPPRRAHDIDWRDSILKRPSMLSPTRFELLNEIHDIVDAAAWNAPERSKLWLYNLHYFDDLGAEGAVARRAWHERLLKRWVEENPPGVGVGWEPYTLSLRIVNWVKWALVHGEPAPYVLDSLAVQVRFLARRLEYHLLGNHLLANAKALVFAGLYFDGVEAANWLDKGLAILERELAEQVLADGGHFELSPMYHAIILEDMLDILNLAECYRGVCKRLPVDSWRQRITQMMHWLQLMCHPDGEIAFFNDAAFGIASAPAELLAYAGRLGLTDIAPVGVRTQTLTHLRETGYVRIDMAPACVALLDVASVGPSYLPAHAHADTLSFELSLLGQRVVVNSGTSCYGTDQERQRQRSTMAHSTVVLNNLNSSDVWAGFRVGRRAKVGLLESTQNDEQIVVRAMHDGYSHLPGRPKPIRTWRHEGNTFSVSDDVSGAAPESARIYFYLHPEIRVEVIEGRDDHRRLILPDGRLIDFSVLGGAVTDIEASWHPHFGISIPNRCLQVKPRQNLIHSVFDWGRVLV